MATYAYLRVSTDEQDVESQKHGILEYANAHDLGKVIYIEDTASGKLNWNERKLGELMYAPRIPAQGRRVPVVAVGSGVLRRLSA